MRGEGLGTRFQGVKGILDCVTVLAAHSVFLHVDVYLVLHFKLKYMTDHMTRLCK